MIGNVKEEFYFLFRNSTLKARLVQDCWYFWNGYQIFNYLRVTLVTQIKKVTIS